MPQVANLWCTLSLLPFLKLKALLSIPALLRLSLGATALGLLPPCALLLLRPSRAGFVLCAAACGLWLVAAWRWSRADRRWVWWHVSFHACSTAANLLLYECLR